MAYSDRTKLGAPRSLPSWYSGTQHTRVCALMHTGKAHAITISIVHGVRRKTTGTRTLWPLAQCATATSTTSATAHGQAHHECQHHECHSHEPQCTTTGTGTSHHQRKRPPRVPRDSHQNSPSLTAGEARVHRGGFSPAPRRSAPRHVMSRCTLAPAQACVRAHRSSRVFTRFPPSLPNRIRGAPAQGGRVAYSARSKLGAPRSLPSRYAGTQHTLSLIHI